MFRQFLLSVPSTCSLANKLQRLCLEQPRVAAQIEQLVDLYLVKDGQARRDAGLAAIRAAAGGAR